MTDRTAAYGRAAFAWAVKRGAVQVNPFSDLPIAKSNDERERVLTDDEMVEVWRAAGGATSPYGAIIRLLILTGQRRGEVAGMTWGELSDDLATWTIGGERTSWLQRGKGAVRDGAKLSRYTEFCRVRTSPFSRLSCVIPTLGNTDSSKSTMAQRSVKLLFYFR